MKRRIRLYSEPILSTVCEPVAIFTDEVKQIAQDLRDTLNGAKNGVGLAAPQIGYAKRIVLVKDMIIVNPEILQKSGNQKSVEGCLSYPRMTRMINRPEKVTVHGYDVEGRELKLEYSNLEAAIACHELDHLNGMCQVNIRKKKKVS